jgi:general secretion pathway protein J
VTRHEKQSREAGFTLVEALVSTVIMTFILATLATITSQWLPAWNHGFTQLLRTQMLATSLDRLSDDLASALFVSVGPADSPPLFDGEESSVTFVRSTLTPNADHGVQVVRIAEVSDDAGLSLVRSTATLPIGAGQASIGDTLSFVEPVVVISSLYRVSFSYASSDRLWRDKWQNQLVLPRAIRIQIRDAATSELLTATTVTRIYAELPVRCTWTGNVTNCGVASSRAAGVAPSASLEDAVDGGGR